MDTPLTRRRVLSAGFGLAAALAGCQSPALSNQAGTDDGTADGGSSDDATGTTVDDGGLADLRLTGQPLATGLTSPVGVEMTGADTGYVVDQSGQLRRLDGGDLLDTPALDVSDRLASNSGREMGLLGLALHPAFAENGRAFVRYSGPTRSETPDGFSHSFVLSEFRAGEDRRTFDPDSEQVLLTIPEPQSNHNAGSVAFGPDGHLYVGVGDGGAGGDQGRGHVDDWYDAVDGGNGQDVTENLLGSVLRIDVDGDGGGGTSGGDRPYTIPDDNPLVGGEGLDEQYAWGFRNPWRFSFGPDGRFFVADVGQSSWEEINVVQRGGNYGWNVREGPECFQADDCPSETPDGEPLRDPVVAYPHSGGDVSGISVIGGYVYEGDAVPALDGRYVFGDFRANGRLFVATEGDGGDWSVTTVLVDGIGSLLNSFGRDADGELLACTTGSGESGDGSVYRLTTA